MGLANSTKAPQATLLLSFISLVKLYKNSSSLLNISQRLNGFLSTLKSWTLGTRPLTNFIQGRKSQILISIYTQ